MENQLNQKSDNTTSNSNNERFANIYEENSKFKFDINLEDLKGKNAEKKVRSITKFTPLRDKKKSLTMVGKNIPIKVTGNEITKYWEIEESIKAPKKENQRLKDKTYTMTLHSPLNKQILLRSSEDTKSSKEIGKVPLERSLSFNEKLKVALSRSDEELESSSTSPTDGDQKKSLFRDLSENKILIQSFAKQIKSSNPIPKNLRQNFNESLHPLILLFLFKRLSEKDIFNLSLVNKLWAKRCSEYKCILFSSFLFFLFSFFYFLFFNSLFKTKKYTNQEILSYKKYWRPRDIT